MEILDILFNDTQFFKSGKTASLPISILFASLNKVLLGKSPGLDIYCVPSRWSHL